MVIIMLLLSTYLNVFAGGKALPSSGVKHPSVSSILNEPSLSEQLLENVFKLHPEKKQINKSNKQFVELHSILIIETVSIKNREFIEYQRRYTVTV